VEDRQSIRPVVPKVEAASVGGLVIFLIGQDFLVRTSPEAEKEEIVITRRGKPAGVLIGFASEDDWFDYRLEHDPRFLDRIEKARKNLRAGRGVRLEDVKD